RASPRLVDLRERRLFLWSCRALLSHLAHRLWSIVRLCRCLRFCLDQVVLLRRCGERRVREVFLFLAVPFPFVLQFFPQPPVVSFFSQALCFSPEAFHPSLPRELSLLLVVSFLSCFL